MAQAGKDKLEPDAVIAGRLPVPVQVLLSTVVEALAEACMQGEVSDDCAAAGMQGAVPASERFVVGMRVVEPSLVRQAYCR